MEYSQTRHYLISLEFGNDNFTQSGSFMCFIDFQSFTLKGGVIYLEYLKGR